MILKNVSEFIVTDKDLYWISLDDELYKNNIKIGSSKSYSNMIYVNDVLYLIDGKNLQVIPANKKIELDRCIFDIQENIVYFYSGLFMNKIYGIAKLNEKKYPEILFETSKAEIYNIYNNRAIGKNREGIVCLNFQDEIIWEYPFSLLGGTEYEPDETDGINKFLGIAHGNIWIYTNFGRLLALDLKTGDVVKKISCNSSDENSTYEMTFGLGDCFLRKSDNNIVSISSFHFQIIDTKQCTIVERYNFAEADPLGIGSYRIVYSPLLQGDYFTFLCKKEEDSGGIRRAGIFDYKSRKLVWEYEVISKEEYYTTGNQLVTYNPLYMSGNRLYIKDISKSLHIFERDDI